MKNGDKDNKNIHPQSLTHKDYALKPSRAPQPKPKPSKLPAKKPPANGA